QLAHRNPAVSVAFLQLAQIGLVAARQGENIRWRTHGQVWIVEEAVDLLLAQALYVERLPRHEVLQMPPALEWTGEFAGAAPHDALAARGILIPNHRGFQLAWAYSGKFERPGILRALF